MQITLRNGEILNLEVTPLFLEYAEDYEGGIDKLVEDVKNNEGYTKKMYAANHLLYAIIASCYEKRILSYKEAVKLVKIEDMEKIIEFVNQNLPSTSNNSTGKVFNHRM